MVTVYHYMCPVRIKCGQGQMNRDRRIETPEWRCFLNARSRCNNPNHPSYEHYGGRGIQFKFETFQEFIDELGIRPQGLQLDRIDNDGHYERGNVRWTTRKVQQSNRTICKKNKVTICGHDEKAHAFGLCRKCYQRVRERKMAKAGHYRSKEHRKKGRDWYRALQADPVRHAAYLKQKREWYHKRKEQHELNDTASSNALSAAA